MSATGMEMESGNVFLNHILVLWNLDCGLLLICTKENSIIFEARYDFLSISLRKNKLFYQHLLNANSDKASARCWSYRIE